MNPDDIESALRRINANLAQNVEGLKAFSRDLFDIARTQNLSFSDTIPTLS